MSFIVLKKKSKAEDAVDLIYKIVRKGIENNSSKQILLNYPFEPTMDWFEKVFWHIDSITDYKLDDPGREQIKTPDKFIADGYGDCDDYATLWLSILKLAGVKAEAKIVDYEDDGFYDHIYVVVPFRDGKYLTLDNVVGKFRKKFNVEVDRKDEKIFRPI